MAFSPVILIGIISVSALIGVVIGLVLLGVPLCRIAKKLNVSGGALAFVPFARYFLMGKLAVEDVKARKPGEKPFNLGIPAMILKAVSLVPTVLYFVMVGKWIADFGMNFNLETVQINLGTDLFILAMSFLILILSIAYSIFTYVILYRIYHVMAGESALWMILVSIFFSIGQLLILYILAFSEKYPEAQPLPASGAFETTADGQPIRQ